MPKSSFLGICSLFRGLVLIFALISVASGTRRRPNHNGHGHGHGNHGHGGNKRPIHYEDDSRGKPNSIPYCMDPGNKIF